MNPNQLFEAAYQPMVDLFRANMRSCGALRIDHVMALLRLWWVPPGEPTPKAPTSITRSTTCSASWPSSPTATSAC